MMRLRNRAPRPPSLQPLRPFDISIKIGYGLKMSRLPRGGLSLFVFLYYYYLLIFSFFFSF